jgi:tetratricopeptide (TPR) repeat protein
VAILLFGLWGSTIGRPRINLSGKAGYEEGKWGYDALLANRNQDAARWLGDAVVYQPKLPAFWFDLGIAYRRLGNKAAALAAFQKAHQLKPNDAKYSEAAAEGSGSVPSSLIPTGMRAVSVYVNEVTGVAGSVAPGTRVDVLVTVKFSGSNEPHNVTILQNVKVLATSQHLDRGTGNPAHVVTLLVLPEDAERLALATQEGHIQLILRN